MLLYSDYLSTFSSGWGDASHSTKRSRSANLDSMTHVFAVLSGWTGRAGLAWLSLGTLGAVGAVGAWESWAALASGDALLADGAEGAGEASLADVSLLALDAGGTRQALEAGWSGRARKTLWAVLALAASVAHTAGGAAFAGCSRGSRCASQTLRAWRPCRTLVAFVALEALLSWRTSLALVAVLTRFADGAGGARETWGRRVSQRLSASPSAAGTAGSYLMISVSVTS